MIGLRLGAILGLVLRLVSLLIVVLVTATAVGTASAAARNDFLIVLGKRIGPFHLNDAGGGPSYAAAVGAFGQPSSKGTDVPGSNLCTVRWRAIGLDLGFASRPGACRGTNLRQAAWYGARVTDGRWRTLRKLRVGDGEAALRRKYPEAKLHDDPPLPPEWWLVTADLGGFEAPTLSAIVEGGAITALKVGAGYVY